MTDSVLEEILKDNPPEVNIFQYENFINSGDICSVSR